MFAWKEILRRAGYLGRRSQFDRELEDEIRFHIETRMEELQREGMPPAAALERVRKSLRSISFLALRAQVLTPAIRPCQGEVREGDPV